MRDLGNSTEADDNAYEVPDEIPGFRKAIQVSNKRQIMQALYISSKVKMQKMKTYLKESFIQQDLKNELAKMTKKMRCFKLAFIGSSITSLITILLMVAMYVLYNEEIIWLKNKGNVVFWSNFYKIKAELKEKETIFRGFVSSKKV